MLNEAWAHFKWNETGPRLGKTLQRRPCLSSWNGAHTPWAPFYLYGHTHPALASAPAVFAGPTLCSSSGLPVNIPASAAEVGNSFPASSLQTAGHCTIIYQQPSISFSLPVYLSSINLLKQHGRHFFFGGRQVKRGPGKALLPGMCLQAPATHTGLWEVAACRSGSSELEWPQASLQPPGAIFQIT